MKHLCLVMTFALIAASALAEEPDWGYTELDDVDLGTCLETWPVSFYDLQGRIVVLYQWGITCPISTGAFPYMNQLNEKYRDRGVAVVGFQVRRAPDVLENNVGWTIEHLKPNFPMCMLGNDWEWPAKYLPWVIVFDHEGKRIHAGDLQGIEKVLDDALDKAPDYMVGGPYEKLGAMAAEIASDRAGVGKRLPALRKLTAGKDAEEAKRMLACITRHFERQVLKAEEDMNGPAEEAMVYRQLASVFEGDKLGETAKKLLEEISARPNHAAEEAAYRELARARLAFRRLPPAGRYAYNMDYSLVTDEEVLDTRGRMIAEFRVECVCVRDKYPDTQAARDAKFLMFEHDMPEIDTAKAKARVEAAEKMLAGTPRPYEIFDAYLQLYEVVEGYFEADDLPVRAMGLFDKLQGPRKEELEAARNAYFALAADEATIREQVRKGGAALTLKEAREHIRMLEIAAKEAGPKSRLARRTATFAEELLKSYDGPGRMYIAVDNRYTGKGVRIARVYPNTSAAAAGLTRGDVILTYEGAKIAALDGLKKAITSGKPGQVVKLGIRRGEAEETLEVRLDRIVR